MVSTARRPSKRSPAFMKHADHAKLWRLVEGAVVDAFEAHPTYLTEHGLKSAVNSITKRVVGQLVGHAKGTLAGGRSGDCSREAAANSLPASASSKGRAEGVRVSDARPHLPPAGGLEE